MRQLLAHLNHHAAVHLVGCYSIALTLSVWGVDQGYALLYAVIAGFVWEVLDHLNGEFGWKFPLLDNKGADFVDFMFDVAGALAAYLMIGVHP